MLKTMPTTKKSTSFSIKGTSWGIDGDLATGFVFKGESYDRHGAIVSKRHQFKNMEPHVFPAGIAETDYSGGAPVLFTYYQVLEWIVNEGVPPDAFHVTVPTGYNVVDYRPNRQTPHVTRNADAPIDALEYRPQTRKASQGVFTERSRKANTPPPPTYLLLLGVTAAALLLVLLVTLLWRRRRANRAQTPK